MDFSRPHILQESVATKSTIRYIDVPTDNGVKDNKDDPVKVNVNAAETEKSLDDRLIGAANRAPQDLVLGPAQDPDTSLINGSLYPDRLTPQSEIIQAGQLVVIFESFDNLNFVYATPEAVFSNRNGSFHHSDFIGKPFGCKIRSNSHRGFGYCFRTYSAACVMSGLVVTKMNVCIIYYIQHASPSHTFLFIIIFLPEYCSLETNA